MHFHIADGFGGAQIHTLRLMQMQRSAGLKVYGLCKRGSDLETKLREAGVDASPVSGLFAGFFGLYRLLLRMKRLNVGILHCHMSSDLRLAVIARLLRPNLRIVYHSHVGIGRPKHDFLHRFVYKRIDAVIAISRFVADQLLSKTPITEAQLSLIPYGIDETVFRPLTDDQREPARAKWGMRMHDYVVCLPGRISDGKGHLLLLEAMSRIDPEVPIKLLFAGGRDFSTESSRRYNDRLDALLQKYALHKKVTLLGHVDSLPKLISCVDVICIPSESEAFGLVVIEAMSCGAAVVGARAGAIPEILDANSGLLLPLDEPDQWAETLAALWRNVELRQRYGFSARQRVLENYTSKIHLERILNLYRQLS